MSFVLVPRHGGKNQDITAPVASAQGNDALEQEIQRRVRQELERLHQTTVDAATSAAEEAARTSVLSLEEQLRQALSALQAANTQLAVPLARKEQDLAELVLDMGFQLARHIIGEHVQQDQAPLLELVTKLLHEASAERTAQQDIIVRLHPSDLAVIQDKLPAIDIELIADTSLAPGDALVELAMKNGDLLDKAEWDARLETRLEAIHNVLLPASRSVE